MSDIKILDASDLLGVDIWGDDLMSAGIMNAASSGGVFHLLKILFTTDDASPLTNPYVGEIGSIVPVAVDGTLAASGGSLTNTAQATPAEGDLAIYSSERFQRVPGRGFYCKMTITAPGTYPIIFLSPNLSGNSSGAELSVRMENPLGVNDGAYLSMGRVLTTTTYEVWLIQKAIGGELIIKGGVFSDWNRAWVFNSGSSPLLAAAVGYYTGTVNIDRIDVKDVVGFSSDVEIKRGDLFTQSLSGELFVNGDFSLWSPANTPTGWTEYNESAGVRDITEVAPGNLHGGGGSGAINIFSSSGAVGVSQSLASIGDLCEIAVDVTAFGSVGPNIYLGGADGVLFSLTAVGSYRMIGRSYTGGAVWPAYLGGAGDFTIDNASFKKITRNAAIAGSNHALAETLFTLPVSPKSHDEICLFYRMTSSTDEYLNGWGLTLRRNAANTQWDATVYSWAAGSRLLKLATITNVGNVTGLRARFDGNNHDWFTQAGAGTAWVKRGTTVSDAAHNTGTYVNVVCSSGFAVNSISVFQNDLAAYADRLTPP